MFQVGGFPLLPWSEVLGSDLGVQRFLSPLFVFPPLSKHLREVEGFLWLVPAHRVTMKTSLLCLILRGAPTNLSRHQLLNLTIGDEFNILLPCKGDIISGYPLSLFSHTRQNLNISLYSTRTHFTKHYSTFIMSVILKLIDHVF